jgi:hypothetical protein
MGLWDNWIGGSVDIGEIGGRGVVGCVDINGICAFGADLIGLGDILLGIAI